MTDCSRSVVPEWAAISFSRGSSQPRAQTRVSRIVDRRFTVLSHQGSPISTLGFQQLTSLLRLEIRLWTGSLRVKRTKKEKKFFNSETFPYLYLVEMERQRG